MTEKILLASGDVAVLLFENGEDGFGLLWVKGQYMIKYGDGAVFSIEHGVNPADSISEEKLSKFELDDLFSQQIEDLAEEDRLDAEKYDQTCQSDSKLQEQIELDVGMWQDVKTFSDLKIVWPVDKPRPICRLSNPEDLYYTFAEIVEVHWMPGCDSNLLEDATFCTHLGEFKKAQFLVAPQP